MQMKESPMEEAEQLDEMGCNEQEMEEGKCGAHESMDEGKKEKCEKCEKAKDDCECPKEAMDEDDDSKFAKNQPPYDKATALDRKGPDGKHNKKNENLKEHKIWNDKGFKMDLNKLLK